MATPYKSTVSDILNTISDIRGETTTNTDAKRIRAISRSEQAISKRKDWTIYYLENQSLTTDGTATLEIGSDSYPLRLKGLVELFIDGTLESNRYTVIDASEFKSKYNANNTEQLCYVTYDAANDEWKVTFSPTPATGLTVTYSYFWTPPARTLITDPVISPDMEALARLSLAEIYDGEDEAELAASERNKVEQILLSNEQDDDSTSPSQLLVMGGNSQGYGTY